MSDESLPLLRTLIDEQMRTNALLERIAKAVEPKRVKAEQAALVETRKSAKDLVEELAAREPKALLTQFQQAYPHVSILMEVINWRDYMRANGYRVSGRAPVKDAEAALRTWLSRSEQHAVKMGYVTRPAPVATGKEKAL